MRNAPQPSNSSFPDSQNNCEIAKALIPAYSIGATTPQETRFVQTMLTQCPELTDELRVYQHIEHVMRHLVPTTEDPPPVEALMARINRENNAATPYQQTGTNPKTNTVPPPLSEKLRALPPQHSQGNRWRIVIYGGLAAAIFALTNLFWYTQLQTIQAEQQRIAQQLDTQQIQIGLVVRQFELFSPEQNVSAPHARMTYDVKSQIGTINVSNFPQIPDDNVYRLWFIRGDQPVAVGHFRPHEDGSGTLLFHTDEPIETFDKMGISPESPTAIIEPTHPHLVIGDV